MQDHDDEYIDEEKEALKKLIIREKCEESHLFFTRYFFKKRQDAKFLVNWHHHVLSNVVEDVISGKIRNIVINIAPGSSKTDTVIVNFIARGIALNPFARFLHLTYSNLLASTNSQTARDIIMSQEYQELWPYSISADDSSKTRWNVMINGKKAGGTYATAIGGQVTGFRAGRMVPNFNGAILIDDPLKPEDAFSKPRTDAANRALISTIKSRKANPTTPIVLIMQRLSMNDPSEFIRKGNMRDVGDWEYLSLPALITEDWIKKNKRFLTPEIEKLIDKSEKDNQGRFSYWAYKEPLDTLLKMEQGNIDTTQDNKISSYVFASQYMQSPKTMLGMIVRGDYFPRYKMLPVLKQRIIVGDTAQKANEHNDFSVFQCWGLGVDNKLYLLDLIRGKWLSPELKKRFIDFWSKHNSLEWERMQIGMLRNAYVEDKVSGTGLIQEIKAMPQLRISIKGIERTKDKVTRLLDGLPFIESGNVLLPDNAPFVNDFIEECEDFRMDLSHKHDDQIDPMLDAIEKLLSHNNKSKVWENII